MNEYKFPTEVVELPSKGLIYPSGHPLRKGTVEMKYMTAKEEDILSNQNYITNGIVLDKLLEALVMNAFDIKDLATGDKNAILVASRILGYGKEYSFIYRGKEHTVDLSKIDNKPFNTDLISPKGTFIFTLPNSGNVVEFRILTIKDEELLEQEIEGLKKINKEISSEVTTTLRHRIVSVDGNNDKTFIKGFIENGLLAMDSMALRKYMKSVSPDINLSTKIVINGVEEDINIPINLNFFWPDL